MAEALLADEGVGIIVGVLVRLGPQQAVHLVLGVADLVVYVDLLRRESRLRSLQLGGRVGERSAGHLEHSLRSLQHCHHGRGHRPRNLLEDVGDELVQVKLRRDSQGGPRRAHAADECRQDLCRRLGPDGGGTADDRHGHGKHSSEVAVRTEDDERHAGHTGKRRLQRKGNEEAQQRDGAANCKEALWRNQSSLEDQLRSVGSGVRGSRDL